jgi:hypothetical protein
MLRLAGPDADSQASIKAVPVPGRPFHIRLADRRLLRFLGSLFGIGPVGAELDDRGTQRSCASGGEMALAAGLSQTH